MYHRLESTTLEGPSHANAAENLGRPDTGDKGVPDFPRDFVSTASLTALQAAVICRSFLGEKNPTICSKISFPRESRVSWPQLLCLSSSWMRSVLARLALRFLLLFSEVDDMSLLDESVAGYFETLIFSWSCA